MSIIRSPFSIRNPGVSSFEMNRFLKVMVLKTVVNTYSIGREILSYKFSIITSEISECRISWKFNGSISSIETSLTEQTDLSIQVKG